MGCRQRATTNAKHTWYAKNANIYGKIGKIATLVINLLKKFSKILNEK